MLRTPDVYAIGTERVPCLRFHLGVIPAHPAATKGLTIQAVLMIPIDLGWSAAVRESWDMLLYLRSQRIGDVSVCAVQGLSSCGYLLLLPLGYCRIAQAHPGQRYCLIVG